MFRKTKIICTIGPACSSPQTLRAMVDAGMNVARLNFSHGTIDQHREVIHRVREIRAETGRSIGILQDLSGPKIRTGLLPETGLPLATGGRAALIPQAADTAAPPPGGIPIRFADLLRDVPLGARILLDDGRIELRAEERTASSLLCRVVHGGTLYSHQGVNFPEIALSSRAPTPKDLEDLRFGLKEGVDFVALSFVQTAEDILTLREHLRANGSDARVIAKLERRIALDHLEEILQASDGVMIARGDLGIEAELTMIPIYQKQITRRANLHRVTTITATQMLDSMIRAPRPTRAEVTDVANAIYDGSDAIMLSGETAIGLYPVGAVSVMRRIADHVEGNLGLDRGWSPEEPELRFYSEQAAVADAVCAAAANLGARCIVAHTVSGYTARLMSHNRPSVPLIAITPSERTYHQLSLVWGAESILMPGLDEDFLATTGRAEQELKKRGWAREGDLLVVSAGIPGSTPGGTNLMKLHRVGGT